MKFLVIYSWAPKHAREVTKRFSEWKPKGKYDVLYPFSTMIGMNKGFHISEGTDMAEMQKDFAYWTDVMTFEIIPIMDSSDAIAASQ